ncbi:hypothetical protein GCM10015535_60650 [Streptomyces gelaticus]|uniref:Uncharacterized protein n=1 Tax=Streptomyces gelaticus TaxID=285446 RepID=A0ABQ2W7B7_9ACTN|nr:hypothetical protein GCM10015535_60650 [Streptomyces gelaticus]
MCGALPGRSGQRFEEVANGRIVQCPGGISLASMTPAESPGPYKRPWDRHAVRAGRRSAGTTPDRQRGHGAGLAASSDSSVARAVC